MKNYSKAHEGGLREEREKFGELRPLSGSEEPPRVRSRLLNAAHNPKAARCVEGLFDHFALL